MTGFIYRGPLAPGSPMFKGRDAELGKLTRLCAGDVKSYGILYGGRQTGKTSLLNQFEKRLKVPTVRVDFQLCPGSNSAEAYSYVSQRVNVALGLNQTGIIQNGPALTQFFCSRLSDSKIPKLVLLFEELGALPDRTREEIANLFRAIFTNRFDKSCPYLSKLVVIFAGNIELYNLASKDVSPLKNICEEIYLGDLSEADAKSLIVSGISGTNLKPQEIHDIASAIYDQVQGHPYLTQRLGSFFETDIGNGGSTSNAIHQVKKTISENDPLLDHLKRMILELSLQESLRSLLRSKIKFSHLDEEMTKLDVLGFAKEKERFWSIRNPLLQEMVADLLQKKPPKAQQRKNPSRARKPKSVKVFVSSTWIDLQAERELVEKTLHKMIDTTFAGMEYFGSQEDTPLKVSMKAVDNSDVYVGIFAHRYGSGITEKEYRRAKRNELPCLIYVKDEDVPVKPVFIEQKADLIEKLNSLKDQLKKNHAVSFFKTSEELASKVTSDLHNLLSKR